MKDLVVLSVLLVALLAVGCSDDTPEPVNPDDPVRELTQTEQTLAEGGNMFGFKLFNALCVEDPNSNVFISPLSVSTAFGMVLNGAKGETRDEMAATLEIAGLTDDEINRNYETLTELLATIDSDVTFEISNSVWPNKHFEVKQDFLDKLIKHYDAEVQVLDFTDPSSPAVINNWVNDKTHGKIPSIIDKIPPEMVMYLINAIYFNAYWTDKFDPELTIDAPFTLSDSSTVSCRMMIKTPVKAGFFENDAIKAVRLPYGNEHYHLVAILPKQGTPDDLAASLTDEKWYLWMGSFHETDVNLGFPKLEMEYEKKLNEILNAMGMKLAFTDNADLSGMSPEEGLFISEVKHKTYVRIDEEGTEAAAVTSIGVGATGAMNPYFYADRPYLFAIWEANSNSVLFIGKIECPIFGEG